MSDPIDTLFSTPEMLALFSAEGHVSRILRFEAAFALAESRAGVMPREAAEAIAAACRVELFDLPGLYREAAVAGTIVIPLVRELSALAGGEAGGYVHWGATSQDAIDTAAMLQMREGIGLIVADLLDLCASCAGLAEAHRHTLMPGRTLMQHALPITVGLKAARWLSLVARQVEALREIEREAIALQLGGAAGTLAALGTAGPEVAALLGAELGLPVPSLPWHAERDRVARIGAALGVVAGAMLKVAGDIVLLSQTEAGEVSEGAAPGKGGSSAMPHKQNPVDSIMARAAARQALATAPLLLGAMDAEHERAAGAWQAEWAALRTLFCAVAGAANRVRSALGGIEVHVERMRANLDLAGGVSMAEAVTVALAPHVGPSEARRLVGVAVGRSRAEGLTLRQALAEDEQVAKVLSPDALDRALDPAAYLGSADVWIDNALAAYRRLRGDAG